MRNVIVKYFFARNDDNINVSAFTNLRGIIFEIGFFALFLIEVSNGFEFTWKEFIYGSFGGVLTSLAMFLMTYVNVRGKGGTSDAIIETCVIYQTILDALIFGRLPNFMQVSGVIVGLGA